MLINKILDCLPDSAKRPFHIIADCLHFITNKNIKRLKRKEDKQRFILMGIPEHGNMGDQAIVYAEEKFMKDFFNVKPIEISSNCYNIFSKYIKKRIKKTDIIIITGGGSLGSLWENEHDHIVRLIKDFPDNHIIIFPQTIYYEDINDPKIPELKDVLVNHKNLLLCVRESNSYEFAMSYLGLSVDKVKLIPDIVLYLNKSCISYNRTVEQCVLVIERKDKEKICNFNNILSKIKNKYSVIYGDTIVRHLRVTEDNRNIELEKILNQFYPAKIVLTDRLHGMILSAITGTNCIAFDNSSKKVSGVYEFIKYLNYVELITNDSENVDFENRLSKDYSRNKYNNLPLMEYYKALADDIRSCQNGG